MEELRVSNGLVKVIQDDMPAARFLLYTSFIAFNSNNAEKITEPFPAFMLKNREIRDKRGNLTVIKEAQEKRQDLKDNNIQYVDSKNKRIEKTLGYLATAIRLFENKLKDIIFDYNRSIHNLVLDFLRNEVTVNLPEQALKQETVQFLSLVNYVFNTVKQDLLFVRADMLEMQQFQ